jgi:FGGY family of carbohydrate kinases, C-terminal domain
VLGGGARSAVWNRIKCDLIGRPLVITENQEAACLGAAILAGRGVGMFNSVAKAVDHMVVLREGLEPDRTVGKRTRRRPKATASSTMTCGGCSLVREPLGGVGGAAGWCTTGAIESGEPRDGREEILQ